MAGIASYFAGRGSGAAQALEAAGCARQTFPSQGRRHVEELPKGFKYNSTPPTSGPHQPQPLAPAIWNSYDQPVPEIKLVHNLEHGGIVVQYGDQISPETVNEILTWYRKDPNAMVVAPLSPALIKEKPTLANEITLSAWTHLQTCKRFNDKAFSNFVDLHRGNGPEPFPVSVLKPGNQ
ncbi:MAG TPA: DUF3105 domain-containing protein [Gaiellaceae bacterium]